MIPSSLVLFDTHCHFDFSPFNDDYFEHFQRCLEVGVERILIPSVGEKNWQTVSALAHQFPQHVYYSLGFHPYFLAQYPNEKEWLELERLLQSKDSHCLALGECGLDWQIEVGRELQIKVFQRQINLASEHQLPLILHARKSHADLIRLLKLAKFRYGGIVHGFSGSKQQAEEWIALGFKIGVGGVITYPRANKTRRAIELLPIESLVLETDAPDMPINGFQGQANHPQRLPLILQELANLKQLDSEDIAPILWANSMNVLGLENKE